MLYCHLHRASITFLISKGWRESWFSLLAEAVAVSAILSTTWACAQLKLAVTFLEKKLIKDCGATHPYYNPTCMSRGYMIGVSVIYMFECVCIYVCVTRFAKTCLNTLHNFLRYGPFSSAESSFFFVDIQRTMSIKTNLSYFRKYWPINALSFSCMERSVAM